MNPSTPALCTILLAGAALGQGNLLGNADFEAPTLSPWSHNGTATHQAAVETYDVAGTGKATRAIAATPYRTRFTVLQDNVVLATGRQYLMTMDIASFWPNPNNASVQSDAGQFFITVGNQLVHHTSLGPVYATSPLLRRKLQFGVQVAQTGATTVRIEMYRDFNGTYGRTPRCYVDNVDLRLAPPKLDARFYGTACGRATFGAAVDAAKMRFDQVVYSGVANSVGLMMIGTRETKVPFLGCEILTDFPVLFPYAIPSSGVWQLQVPIPAAFRGPINIQHVVRLPDSTIAATQAVKVGYF